MDTSDVDTILTWGTNVPPSGSNYFIGNSTPPLFPMGWIHILVPNFHWGARESTRRLLVGAPQHRSPSINEAFSRFSTKKRLLKFNKWNSSRLQYSSALLCILDHPFDQCMPKIQKLCSRWSQPFQISNFAWNLVQTFLTAFWLFKRQEKEPEKEIVSGNADISINWSSRI